jgi:hypothetical protein
MQTAIFVAAIVIVDVIVIATVLRIVFRSAWQPLMQRFPAKEVREPAFSKRYQSFSVGIVNLAGCVEVTIDDDHLHLRPAVLLRKLGLESLSIPWGAISPLERGGEGSSSSRVQVMVGDTRVSGPRWCFRLVLDTADPPTAGD